jgi:hypothetical protein
MEAMEERVRTEKEEAGKGLQKKFFKEEKEIKKKSQ